MEINHILNERQGTHGDFSDNARIQVGILRQLGLLEPEHELSDVQLASLIAISGKMCRIMSGNNNEADHWRDIQGYAKLAEDRIGYTLAKGDTSV